MEKAFAFNPTSGGGGCEVAGGGGAGPFRLPYIRLSLWDEVSLQLLTGDSGRFTLPGGGGARRFPGM
jgi:hypothetical protein